MWPNERRSPAIASRHGLESSSRGNLEGSRAGFESYGRGLVLDDRPTGGPPPSAPGRSAPRNLAPLGIGRPLGPIDPVSEVAAVSSEKLPWRRPQQMATPPVAPTVQPPPPLSQQLPQQAPQQQRLSQQGQFQGNLQQNSNRPGAAGGWSTTSGRPPSRPGGQGLSGLCDAHEALGFLPADHDTPLAEVKSGTAQRPPERRESRESRGRGAWATGPIDHFPGPGGTSCSSHLNSKQSIAGLPIQSPRAAWDDKDIGHAPPLVSKWAFAEDGDEPWAVAQSEDVRREEVDKHVDDLQDEDEEEAVVVQQLEKQARGVVSGMMDMFLREDSGDGSGGETEPGHDSDNDSWGWSVVEDLDREDEEVEASCSPSISAMSSKAPPWSQKAPWNSQGLQDNRVHIQDIKTRPVRQPARVKTKSQRRQLPGASESDAGLRRHRNERELGSGGRAAEIAQQQRREQQARMERSLAAVDRSMGRPTSRCGSAAGNNRMM